MTLRRADGSKEVWKYFKGNAEALAAFDWRKKKDLEALNKWRNQIYDREGFRWGENVKRWTVPEKDVAKNIIRRRLRRTALGKASEEAVRRDLKNPDWVKITKRHRRYMIDVIGTAPLGTPFARTTRSAPKAVARLGGRKPQTDVVKYYWKYPARKKTALKRVVDTFKDISKDLEEGYKKPKDGSAHPWDDIDSDFSCDSESSDDSEAPESENEDSWDDSDPGLNREESDDDGCW